MGSGTSNLTAEQKATLTKELKAAFETCKADNLEDEIIQSTLMSQYKKALEEFSKDESKQEAHKLDAHHAKKADFDPHSVSRQNSKVTLHTRSGTAGGKNKPTRRRSFDTAIKKVISQVKVADTLDTGILASPTNEDIAVAAKEAADSWESVSQQPFCNICQMAFKNTSFLDRHVKYSELHTKNVKKLEAKDNPQTEEGGPTSPAGIIEKVESQEKEVMKPEIFAEKQVEGQHYKLLYTGSKLYWRYQKNIDIDLYHHILPHSIEVITFDPEKHKELNRIYLDYLTITENIEAAVMEEVESRKKEMAMDRFAVIDEIQLKNEIQMNKIITYVLQRLQCDIRPGLLPIMEFAKLVNDNTMKSPVYENKPIVLIPVNVTRRRRTNAEEIENMMNSIHTDRVSINRDIEKARHLSKDKEALQQATLKAAKVANIVFEAGTLIGRKKWWWKCSKWRRKWIWAIRIIIRQKYVAQMKQYLIQKNIPIVATKTTATGNLMSSRSSLLKVTPKSETVTQKAKDI